MTAAIAIPTPPRTRIVAPLMLAALGVCGMAAAWALIALIANRHCAWMAVLTAIDLALLLRLGRAAPGLPRAIATVVATFITILFANWIIAATQIGGQFGLDLVDSVVRLGADHARTLFGLANRPAELAWYAIAAIVGLWLGR